MTAANNIINILQPYLKKIEYAYKRVLYFDDIDYQKNGYAVGKGGLIISVKKGDASLTIQVIEEMALENIEEYLTDCCLPGTWKGFAHKIPEEVREILEKLCDILLEPPADGIDAKILMRKVEEIESDYYRKHPPISEHTMQAMDGSHQANNTTDMVASFLAHTEIQEDDGQETPVMKMT